MGDLHLAVRESYRRGEKSLVEELVRGLRGDHGGANRRKPSFLGAVSGLADESNMAWTGVDWSAVRASPTIVFQAAAECLVHLYWTDMSHGRSDEALY